MRSWPFERCTGGASPKAGVGESFVLMFRIAGPGEKSSTARDGGCSHTEDSRLAVLAAIDADVALAASRGSLRPPCWCGAAAERGDR